VKFEQHPSAHNQRAVMKETEDENLAEGNGQKLRSCNLIIHGVGDGAGGCMATKQKEFVNYFIGALSLGTINFKSVSRVGNAMPDKKRPMIVSHG